MLVAQSLLVVQSLLVAALADSSATAGSTVSAGSTVTAGSSCVVTESLLVVSYRFISATTFNCSPVMIITATSCQYCFYTVLYPGRVFHSLLSAYTHHEPQGSYCINGRNRIAAAYAHHEPQGSYCINGRNRIAATESIHASRTKRARGTHFQFLCVEWRPRLSFCSLNTRHTFAGGMDKRKPASFTPAMMRSLTCFKMGHRRLRWIDTYVYFFRERVIP